MLTLTSPDRTVPDVESPHPRLSACIGRIVPAGEDQALDVQLQDSQQLATVGRLAATAAHDFNNIITAIQGFASLAKMNRSADHEGSDELDEILELTAQAKRIAGLLLDVGRRRSNGRPPAADVSSILRTASPVLRTLLGPTRSLDLDVPRTPMLVRIDPAQLQQVIVNLTMNAKDAMPDSGTLRVTSRIEQTQSLGGRHMATTVRIDVTDSGAGIPAAILPHIFEPLFTTKPDGEGTGLGLAVARSIVEDAGGNITARTVVNGGTTFTIRLPEVTVAPLADSQEIPIYETEVQNTAAARSVLLVDDEPAVRRATRRLLERDGYSVIEAEDGEVALLVLGSHREEIGAILTDLTMPGLSGSALIERFRESAPEVGCIVMSGYADTTLTVAPEDGVLTILAKPFRSDALLKDVRRFFDATAARRAA
jgi:nitrogen-specific signal transduction histidine kinase/CheY-like chemotaxis protein